MFNLSDETCRRIVHCSLAELQASDNPSSTSADQTEETCNSGSKEDGDTLCPPTTNYESLEVVDGVRTNRVCNGASSTNTRKTIKPGEKAPSAAIKSWRENGFSSLIVTAPNMDAWDIIKKLVPLLSYSSPFVVYHQYLQTLAECMHNLQIEKMAIGLQIYEPWLREY